MRGCFRGDIFAAGMTMDDINLYRGVREVGSVGVRVAGRRQ